MLEFSPIKLSDKQWIQPLLSRPGDMGSENAFGTLFIWGEAYGNKVCRRNDGALLCFGEQPSYYFPVGEIDLRLALSLMIADAGEREAGFRMWGMTKTQTEQMEAAMPHTFTFTLERAGSDYIYSTDDLINLKGRKFEKKRNHLARFRRTYSYNYEEVSSANIADCISIAQEWRSANPAPDERNITIENSAIDIALDNFEQLGLVGGLLRIGGKPVAFTVGEEINASTFLLHFEKALGDYDGLYAAINQEFAAKHLGQYKYVNREEDMGVEGLRKAKLSYNPVILLDKFSAVLKEQT